MSGHGPIVYQTTYRRTERALPLMVGGLAIGGLTMFAIIRFADAKSIESAIIVLVAAYIAFLFAVLANTYRIHRWSVGSDGVFVDEDPKVPFTGLSRHAFIAFPAIAALRQVESGFDRLLEMVTRDGRRYRMPQAVLANSTGFRRPDPDPAADLSAFTSAFRVAAIRAGHDLPSVTQGISFWNTIPGLLFLALLFIFSLMIAAIVAWALWDGMAVQQSRGGQAAAIALLLPVGTGYLLLKSFRRRSAVQAADGAQKARSAV